MPVTTPIANFNLSKSALIVNFYDASLNNPTSWLWDFGDGTTSTVQNPSHTYASDGFYVVELTATNSAGSSDILRLSIGVSSTNSQIGNYSIWFMSEQLIPDGLRDQIEDNEKHSMIATWQDYLYPIIPSDITKPDDVIDRHIETQYDSMVNELIAKLVSYELIIQAANQFVSGSAIDTTDSFEETETEREIKKIETGPTSTEWHPSQGSQDTDATASAISSAVKAGGTVDQLKQQICQLSKRLRIYLPMCGQLNHSPQVMSKKSPDAPTTKIWPSFIPE